MERTVVSRRSVVRGAGSRRKGRIVVVERPETPFHPETDRGTLGQTSVGRRIY